jgi:hypothetical protein
MPINNQLDINNLQVNTASAKTSGGCCWCKNQLNQETQRTRKEQGRNLDGLTPAHHSTRTCLYTQQHMNSQCGSTPGCYCDNYMLCLQFTAVCQEPQCVYRMQRPWHTDPKPTTPNRHTYHYKLYSAQSHMTPRAVQCSGRASVHLLPYVLRWEGLCTPGCHMRCAGSASVQLATKCAALQLLHRTEGGVH